ncbi:cysteine-rich with EGF-like domain protein 2 isoform X3 [Brachyistius frenatus]|uniref:cysteine-rich with EGF-like domain protein 2 isoform X3 n=1 Tax=Brachyistius frenatus TaxID=100188 RepID=UPI0037E8076B
MAEMLSTGPEPRLLRMLSCATLFVLLQVTDAKKDLKSACSTCQQITDNFNKGFERTAKQNFGGGNTAWEERKLSKYETSEIRLMEIVEGLCESSSFECNRMVEEHEDTFETWWFKRKTKHPDLHRWFCVDALEVCCPKGTFGLDCNACAGGSERPCHGNGLCDGDGTRGGTGECSCDRAYRGELCLDCIDGYFSEERNDTFSLCAECHPSCKTCAGATDRDCDECKEGWEEGGRDACVACDEVCSGCTGAGPDMCRSCAGGYQNTEGTCTDVDECSQAESVCTKERQECVNMPGSYVCTCPGGYEERDGECAQTPQQDEEEESEASETTTSPHREL